MALNAKLWRNGGSECRTEDMALNAKLRRSDEREYAPVWRVVTTLDPYIIKPKEVS